MKHSACWATALGMALGGCAAAGHHPATRPSSLPSTAQATQDVSRVPLDQLDPPLTLAAPPTSEPTTRPSLEALELFGRAREAQLENQRYTAINLLEKALELDPQSVELNASLGRAYLTSGGPPDRGIAAFEKVRKLDPQNLEAYVELARAYQSRNDSDAVIKTLRTARLTSAYKANDPLASAVDYHLGFALRQQGFYEAAVESYQSLLNRIQHSGMSRTTPEVSYVLTRPDQLFETLATLYEKLGNFPAALDIYQTVADQSPTDFDAQQRVVRTLLKMHRRDAAQTQARQLVRQFHANPDSLSLLRDAYESKGESFVGALQKLHKDQPNDRALLFALTDTLAATGESAEARQLLSDAMKSSGGDVEVVERAWRLERDAGDLSAAARLLIQASADHPQITSELTPMFTSLLGVSRAGTLRLSAIEKLPLPPDAEAARQYWICQTALIFQRTLSADAALQKAIAADKPFDPAYRALLVMQHRKPNGEAEIAAFADQLARTVSEKGRPDLGLELQGLAAFYLKQFDRSAELLTAARKSAAAPSPDVQLELASALQGQGNGPKFEQEMWKLISDHPRFDEAYLVLGAYFREANELPQAAEVDQKWLAAAPNSPAGRLQEIRDLFVQQRLDDAIPAMVRLFQQLPDNAEVVNAISEWLRELQQAPRMISLFEAERSKHPNNVLVVDALVSEYLLERNAAAAKTDLAATRQAVGKDPELLYFLASIYQKAQDNDSAEAVLMEVLKLDPNDAQAGNDLGYTWADAGKNLPLAEKYIRRAVDAEPDNTSFLDSLGWVLYKRGLFAEARTQLDAATKPLSLADPIVLDHFGDTLYRLKMPQEAMKAWKQSLDKAQISERDDLKTLPAKLLRKLQQAGNGGAVEVAPIAGQTSATQPQNAAPAAVNDMLPVD